MISFIKTYEFYHSFNLYQDIIGFNSVFIFNILKSISFFIILSVSSQLMNLKSSPKHFEKELVQLIRMIYLHNFPHLKRIQNNLFACGKTGSRRKTKRINRSVRRYTMVVYHGSIRYPAGIKMQCVQPLKAFPKMK